MKGQPESEPSFALPVRARPRVSRLDPLSGPETVLYRRRPGLRALPEGGGALIGFGALQLFPLLVLLWAVWWPTPVTVHGMVFAICFTVLIGLLSLGICYLLLRGRTATAHQLVFLPFIRLTVTTHRVSWTVPWRRVPMFEIESFRVRGGMLGNEDRRGWAPAAILLHPGDPVADEDGMIQFDRLPDAARFVEALTRLG
jgi:hypothetical protein